MSPFIACCKKTEAALYYRKAKILITITISFVIIVSMLLTGCSESSADVKVLWMGLDEIPDTLSQKLNDALSSSINDINKDGVRNIEFVTINSMDSPLKKFLTLFSDDTQVVILDLGDFITYTKNDTFRPIDDLVEKSSFNVEIHPEIKMGTDNDSTEYIYGLPLEGNKLFTDIGLDMKSIYIAVNGAGKEDKMKENGLNIIKALLQQE